MPRDWNGPFLPNKRRSSPLFDDWISPRMVQIDSIPWLNLGQKLFLLSLPDQWPYHTQESTRNLDMASGEKLITFKQELSADILADRAEIVWNQVGSLLSSSYPGTNNGWAGSSGCYSYYFWQRIEQVRQEEGNTEQPTSRLEYFCNHQFSLLQMSALLAPTGAL